MQLELSGVDSPTFQALTLWSTYRNISKCLATWLPVRRVNYYRDESCNSSWVESTHWHFRPSPSEAYTEIFLSVLRPDFQWDESTITVTSHATQVEWNRLADISCPHPLKHIPKYFYKCLGTWLPVRWVERPLRRLVSFCVYWTTLTFMTVAVCTLGCYERWINFV